MPRLPLVVIVILSLTARQPGLHAAEIATITPENAAELAPDGKEADWIHGDHVLRNGKLVAVVARPVATRHANMTVRDVGGCIIDLTSRREPNDQLGCYYPAVGAAYREATASADGGPPATGENLAARGGRVRLEAVAKATAGRPAVTVAYELADGDAFLTVTTTWSNPGSKPLPVNLADTVRADRTFTSAIATADGVAWWDDEWFRQAYAIMPLDAGFKAGRDGAVANIPGRDPVVFVPTSGVVTELAPGGTLTLVRRVFPAGSLLEARGMALELAGRDRVRVTALARDEAGPVAGAIVSAVDPGGARHAGGRTAADGRIAFDLPRGPAAWTLVVDATAGGRGSVELPLDVSGQATAGDRAVSVEAVLPRPGVVVATITDAAGGPIPCKVQFRGKGVPDPAFGPDSADTAVKNVVYSADGRFRAELAPGSYEAIVSRGPEHDAVVTTIEAARGVETLLAARLVRVVDTRGWISGDFHSHSSPSGDNTSSQLGRVQNLLAEHVEFAPCTEHNRVSSYAPHLERLGAAHLMATCTGMELTGSLLPVNHQNAFPLVERPRTQDGGGPAADNADPAAQIERLALWDDDADKVVQMNHPNLRQILGDRDTDGTADAGFERMLGFVDVVEVHPLADIFSLPKPDADPRKADHTIVRWLQMLNLGYTIPGVVNTDAHYNFHGSGFLRNYLVSPTDDPAAVRIDDVIRVCRAGRIVMTSGPFLEATAKAAGGDVAAGPGELLRAAGGDVEVRIRVQCPNWLDVDRVQVFVDGRAEPALTFTRREHPAMFTRDVVRFDRTVPVKLPRDAHLVVATIGEGENLGLVMGPEHAKKPPVAVTNPIFVDVDGGGFAPSGDLLGLPLHHQGRPGRRHRHPHPHPHGTATEPTPAAGAAGTPAGGDRR